MDPSLVLNLLQGALKGPWVWLGKTQDVCREDVVERILELGFKPLCGSCTACVSSKDEAANRCGMCTHQL